MHTDPDHLDFSFPITAQVRPVPLDESTRDALRDAVQTAAERICCRPSTTRLPRAGQLLDSPEVDAVVSRPRSVTFDDVADTWRGMRAEFALRFGMK
jgi:hypothetical protein